MNINTSILRPSTIAAIIADLLNDDYLPEFELIESLVQQLERLVGEELAIEYMVDAGITPEQLYIAD